MIDTVGFRAEITPNQYYLIDKKSERHTGYHAESGELIYRILKDKVSIGSYDSNVTIRSYDENFVDFQVSLPKQYYGNNVQLLPCRLVEAAMSRVYDGLRGYFGDWPPYKVWEVTRLDLCFAWRFADQPTVVDIIRVLSCFDFPRKKKHIYPNESVEWSGRAYTVKFYLKQPELLKHLGLSILDEDIRRNDFLTNLSSGVLRFEISFKHRMLQELFYGKSHITYLDLLDEAHIIEILNKYKNKLFSNLDPHLTSDQDVLSKLKTNFSHKKALRLYTFYKQYYSDKPHEKQFFVNNYSQSTLWRNKHDLSIAKVGIPNFDIPLNFNLDIPSDLAVSLLPPATAGAVSPIGLGNIVTPPKPCIDAI